MLERVKRLLFGAPRDIEDPRVFHSLSLIAFLAWVGLGADGLSSSAYGPEESFKVLGDHHYLAVALALAIAGTVFIIAYSYSKIIERFPLGGGGYVVVNRLLGPAPGLISGSALLIDYVLTIAVSVAAAIDAFFSFLPLEFHGLKTPAAVGLISFLTAINLRGVKESIKLLLPIFVLFLLTHIVLLGGTIALHLGDVPTLAGHINGEFRSGLETLGLAGMLALFLRAYSLGAGTYTGIEAVSNGLQIMREPKVETGKRTMTYMAVSLALTASGIILCYLLAGATPETGKTMNAVLVERFVEALGWAGSQHGDWMIWSVLVSEAALLVVAAQAGFIAGPRVMSNMANDSWLPHRFVTLSDRLTMQDGVLLTSGASLATLLYTGGETSTLVLMYSINVFITFSLSQAAMVRYWLALKEDPSRKRNLRVHVIALILCTSILLVSLYEKFAEGGWVTLVFTSGLVALCMLVRRHYTAVHKNLGRLDEILTTLPEVAEASPPQLSPKAPTAILLVGRYGGLGIHSLLAIQRLFPNYFKNFIFVSVGVVDTATFQGVEAVEEVREKTEQSLKRYVELARRWGLAADYRMSLSTEVVEEAERLCLEISREFPRSIVFAGKLVFQQERWFQRILHNETAFQLQRRLQFSGLSAMVLPVRVLSGSAS
ncbi:MAG: APC family permease [Elusimicrobia bacterium]|nr:APC family permease [Elusimicrobiota bacterium]